MQKGFPKNGSKGPPIKLDKIRGNLLEHDVELSESVLRYTRYVLGFDLVLQVLLHAHVQLVQLVPLLPKPHCTVVRVPREG